VVVVAIYCGAAALKEGGMGILTDDMKRVVREQKLGFIATVCPDGTPNLSPKGTTAVWDDDHLIFVDISSPGTVANLRQNPAIEINVVDQPHGAQGRRAPGGRTLCHVASSWRSIEDLASLTSWR
jgi:predicted pyridoxine 5'-phosphate oxidase superfamily flavin-nucleotide-binding protein